jgi:hypothetical protein
MRLLAAAAVAVMSIAAAPAPSLDLPPEGVYGTADATVTAERGTQVQVEPTAAPPPPANVAPPGLSNCDEMSWYRQFVGLPARFDALGWRESNCRNEEGVHTSCCWGYWQLNVALHLRDSRLAGRYHNCGVYGRTDVDGDNPGDKYRQACAAKALYDVVGLSAWAT